VGFISALSILLFSKLHRDAGAEVSGRSHHKPSTAGAMGATPPLPKQAPETVED